ncbi:MAG: hypothetical protein SWY16_18475 [Cyanobacteriota bacterium]|nr:hypothetical protein [Cyanobacteriota bacterium]
MDSLLASAILSVSTNIDNLAIGVAYGVRRFAIGWSANFLIASLSGISTLTSMSAGDWVSRFLPANIAGAIGSGILVAVGIWGLWDALQVRSNLAGELDSEELKYLGDESEAKPTIDNLQTSPSNLKIAQFDRHIDLKDALILGLALTVTNLGTGIGAGMAQLNPSLTSSFSFCSSLLTIGGGVFLGRLFSSWRSGGRLDIVSGLLLIGLGLYEYWAG